MIETAPEIDTQLKITDCHWLPCTIDYDGLAPVHVHFRPEPVLHHNCVNNDSNVNSSGIQIRAASFRGRGLISTTATTTTNNSNDKSTLLPDHIVGSVMMPTASLNTNDQFHDHDHNNSHSNSAGAVMMKERFDRILEWEHKHEHVHESTNRRSLTHDTDCSSNDIQSQNSIARSLGIFELLHSVHDPIPVQS